MKFVNLTPHDIVIGNDMVEFVKIKPSGTVARVKMEREDIGNYEWEGLIIPKIKYTPGEIEGLPEPNGEDIFIVSSKVLERTTRPDVVAPDTDKAVRANDKHPTLDEGAIISVPGFVSNYDNDKRSLHPYEVIHLEGMRRDLKACMGWVDEILEIDNLNTSDTLVKAALISAYVSTLNRNIQEVLDALNLPPEEEIPI